MQIIFNDTERKAWFCPACQKHHAPHVETCPAPVDAVSDKVLPPVRTWTPWGPQPATPVYDPNFCSVTFPYDPNVTLINGAGA